MAGDHPQCKVAASLCKLEDAKSDEGALQERHTTPIAEHKALKAKQGTREVHRQPTTLRKCKVCLSCGAKRGNATIQCGCGAMFPNKSGLRKSSSVKPEEAHDFIVGLPTMTDEEEAEELYANLLLQSTLQRVNEVVAQKYLLPAEWLL